ncbi:hypothetical protein ACH0AE_13005 [Sphingomonas sp. 179-A 2A2 NHS]|jgi:hypothetical protein
MMRGPCPTILLGRALTASAALAGTPIEITADETTAWHSATFSGARHAIEMRAPVAARSWLETVGDIDVSLPGHLLAELSVTRRSESAGMLHVRIEALTVVGA